MAGNSAKEATIDWRPRFGSVAVEMGYATPAQIKSAIEEQVDDDIRRKPRRPMGKILFERGWMSYREVEIVLNEVLNLKSNTNSAGIF